MQRKSREFRFYSNDYLEIIFELSTNHLVKSRPTKTRSLFVISAFLISTRVFYTKFLDYISVTSSDVITSNFVRDESDHLLSSGDISKL